MILDIGCGDNPKGDINVDLYRYSNETGNFQKLPYRRIKTKCDIIATGEHLPFKDNTFTLVVSYQVIEHTHDPKRFLSEAIRVSKFKVIIECPHRKGQTAKIIYHRHYLDEKWFVANLKTTYAFHCEISKAPYFPLAIQSKNRFIRHFVKRYWPIKRLDKLRVEIIV